MKISNDQVRAWRIEVESAVGHFSARLALMSHEGTPDEERWPAVRRAYDFVLPSYQMLASRFEAADTRLTVIMNLAATLTLGAPLLAKSIRPKYLIHVALVPGGRRDICGRVRDRNCWASSGIPYVARSEEAL